MLNERSRGWLKFLHRKAITPDDWSEAGEPHTWWDTWSHAPVTNFHRFDIEMSTWALPMYVDQTPAWREVYAEILNGLLQRHLTWRAAIDWVTMIGNDPDRRSYPELWRDLFIPDPLWGVYDRPGWTGNGLPPWGIQPDPIGTDGNLFFKGWLNFMLSCYGYVAGDDRWHHPFRCTGIDSEQFLWNHRGVNDVLVQQWTDRPDGPHCENTKIWPLCLSGAGLGLKMFDNLYGENGHRVYDNWVDILRSQYSAVTVGGHVEWMALYFDPIEGFIQRARPTAMVTNALYMLPQEPEFAEALYRTAVEQTRWNDPSVPIGDVPDPRPMTMALVLAKELGDDVTFAHLSDYAERNWEPAFFGSDMSEFGWWFHNGEPYPRGQLNAILAMQELGGPGTWSKPWAEPNLAKFAQPTVIGVDFPNLGLSRAIFDDDRSALVLTSYVGTRSHAGRATSFRITQLDHPELCTVRCDGQAFDRWGVVAPDTIQLDLDIAEHEIEVSVRQNERNKTDGQHTTLLRGPRPGTGLGPDRPTPRVGPAPFVTTGGSLLSSSDAPDGGCQCC